MIRQTISILAVMAIAILVSSCGRDWYGDTFVRRELVTFHVQNDTGNPLKGVEVKAVEVDAFDNDPIVGRTQYAYTDDDGMVTIKVAFDDEEGYSSLSERTNRFTFTATDYAVFDTLFNYWDGTIEIMLQRE